MGLAIIMLVATTYGFFRTGRTIKNGRLHSVTVRHRRS